LAALIFFPGASIGFVLLLGTLLAPTDAALGLPIFNNPRVPVRVRRAFNVESALNDGIAAPLVVIFIALVLEDYTSVGNFWVVTALAEITIGALVGLLLGWGGGWLPDLAGRWRSDRRCGR
jgi:NhaP-type Na+/H+ or K+/H+ antiporter